MIDREKVKQGLECCCEHIKGMNCDKCPYDKEQVEIGQINQCTSELAYDALALLKEQEHEVCENCPYKLEDIGDFSDGYHTFNDLYKQRAVLFATIVNQNLDKAWKSRKHEDGEPCFGGGWFIVGIDTPVGSYTYHYEDKYWDVYKCVELPVAKHWDGHTDKDVWRLLTLEGR